jgi:protein SCO1/2/putative membrane protein
VDYVHYLPTLNAILNGTAAVLLTWGFFLIKNRRIREHRRVMKTAFGVSVAFLISYLFYHAKVGSVSFKHPGPLRTVYLSILLTHTVLAATVPVLAIVTLNRALKARFDRHVAIAHWALPIWLYVSVTGVVVYMMLYHL